MAAVGTRLAQPPAYRRIDRLLDRVLDSNLLLGLVCAIPAAFATIVLHLLASPSNPLPLPLFDNSPALLDPSPSPLIRWDAIHFLSVASGGYQFEQQLAFQPGWQIAVQQVGRVWRTLFGESEDPAQAIIRGSGVFMLFLAGVRGCLLFRLTDIAAGRRPATVATAMYLLAPTPAVLVSPYTEPLYACFTFAGYILALRQRHMLASLVLASATSIRATGIFAAPLLAAMSVFREGSLRLPFKVLARRALTVVLPSILVVLPFIAFQAYSYMALCKPQPTRPWCHARIPMAYSFVQKKYWNIGFLNYWTPAQIPNIAIASPVLAVSLFGTFRFFTSRTALSRRLAPMMLHHASMTFLLLFGSHTQIALRVISTDPVFWWILADISFEKGRSGMNRVGRAWLWWAVIWGAISIVLWAGHYPPA